MTRGGRNLIILGVMSILIATATTGVSLAVYHNSGDIYLDRSRPGFLPEEGEDGDGTDDGYELDEKQPVTSEVLEEYLEEFRKEIEAVEAYEEPFSAEVLSDERLGI